MVGHDDECVQMDLSSIFKQTMIKDESSGFFEEDELSPSAEVYKICSTILFDVGKVSSIVSAHNLNQKPPNLHLWTAAAPAALKISGRRRGRLRSTIHLVI